MKIVCLTMWTTVCLSAQTLAGNFALGGNTALGPRGVVPAPATSITAASDGYSDTSINTVDLVTNNLATCGGVELLGYVNTSLAVKIAARNLSTNAVTVYSPGFSVDTNDEHKQVSLACDSTGYIHIWYGMHSSALLYRRSTAPYDPSAFSDTLSMLGTNESSVTYPMPIVKPNGDLYFTFRAGDSGNGDQYFYGPYNTGTHVWVAASGTGTAGLIINGRVTPLSAYLNGPPKWDLTGNLWWSWSWGVTSTPTGIKNEYVIYWDGSAFKKADGSAQTIPATDSNLTVIQSFDVTKHLSPQNNFWVSAAGTVFVAYARDDARSNQQVYVMENSTGTFVEHVLTTNIGSYSTHYGTFNVTVVGSGSSVYVIYTDIYNQNGITGKKSSDNFGTFSWASVTSDYNPNLSVIPNNQRLATGILSFIFQHTNDPVFGVPDPSAGPTINILEWVLD